MKMKIIIKERLNYRVEEALFKELDFLGIDYEVEE